MRWRGGGLVVVTVAFLACAGGPARGPVAQMPERAAAYAQPEPDPVCRGTVQESLAANGLERVVVKLARAPGGAVRVVEFLSPDVSPAAKVELTRAFGECAWAPPPPQVQGPEVWTEIVETPAPAR
jgi:hypothetical protein